MSYQTTNSGSGGVGRSTIDAITRVKEIVREKLGRGMEVIAVSIDIKNAFNTIEWGEIRKAIKRKQIPEYLQ